MLTHSPPLPLVIDYFSLKKDITTEDEEGIILALEKRDRVCRIRLTVPFPKLQRIILAIDGVYPRLEYLIMGPLMGENSTAMMLPKRFQAPRLCHLLLKSFALPMESRLLTTAVGLVALTLILDHPSAYLQPNSVLQLLSFMPRLEMCGINFSYPVSDDDVERQLIHIPTLTHVILPSLRSFLFRGVGAYMRAVAPWLTTPRLEKLEIDFNQLTNSVPPLLQFIETTENLRFDSVKLEFDFSKSRFFVGMYLRDEVETYALSMNVYYWDLNGEVVSFVAHIFNSLSQIFSSVENLTFEHRRPSRSSEEHIDVDRTEWRRLLRSFSNVKTLRVNGRLVKELSRCLRLDDGGDPLELLPKLQELTYWGPILGGSYARDAFRSFADTRQNAGRPITLMHRRCRR
jgi:hypothetical protein